MDRKTARKEITALLIPIVLENIFQFSASLITVAMIGRLTAQEIAAQGMAMRITELLNGLFRGIALGLTVLMARAYGERDEAGCLGGFRQSMLSVLPLGIGISLGIFFFPIPVLKLLSGDAGLLALSAPYLKIAILGFPFVVIMSMVAATFQGRGDTKSPMRIAVLVNIVNLSLGYPFIFTLGWGINGAALALLLSQMTGAFSGICLLRKKVFPQALRREVGVKWNAAQQKAIYGTGVPAACENVFWHISAILMSRFVLSYGEASFSAYQLGIQAEFITEIPAMGFSIAATTLAAKAIGEKSPEALEAYFKEQIRLCGWLSVITSSLLIFLPHQFMALMTDKPEIQEIGALYVFVMGFIQIPQNLSRIYSGNLRSAGWKNTPMLVSFCGIWLLRIPLAFLISRVWKADIVWIWRAIALDQVFRMFLSRGLFKKKKVLETAAS